MKKIITITLIILLSTIFLVNCNKKSPTESKNSCGDGKGYPVEFCRQVDNYEAGYGVPNEDYIIVDCLVGPKGATVSNQKNGTYYCAGTYKLSTYSNAEISLNWGGSTQYSLYETYEIYSQGEGSFSIKVTKTSGGSGNIYLSMASGSNWMFDTVLINENCNAVSKNLNITRLSNDATSYSESNNIIEKKVNKIYNSN